MKRENSLIIWVMLLCLCHSSCSDKEDDAMVYPSSLQVYGMQYHLTFGVLWKNNRNIQITTEPFTYYDVYTDAAGKEHKDTVQGFSAGNVRREIGNFMLSLYEPGLSFNATLENVEGKGACICFHLSSSETEQLIPGKYIYGETQEVGTFTAYSSVLYNTQETGDPAKIIGGEVIIEKNGEDYHIVFSGVTQLGADVAVQYDGSLRECKVRQMAVAVYEDAAVAGLLDTVVIQTVMGGMSFPPTATPDYSNGAAFFSTSTGTVRFAGDVGKEAVDIALYWDKTRESFVFESPIRMRRYLGHDSNYNFPCHTIYMKAPASFTDEDFEKLEDDGFSFDIIEEEVLFGTRDFQPGYVFFQTGNGMQGVIHVKRFTPLGSKVEEAFGGLIVSTSPVNPALIMDIKCPANFIDPLIR